LGAFTADERARLESELYAKVREHVSAWIDAHKTVT
jgi:hypothetical protein